MHCGLDVPINLLKLIGHSVAKNRVKRYVATSWPAMYSPHEESTWRNFLSVFRGGHLISVSIPPRYYAYSLRVGGEDIT